MSTIADHNKYGTGDPYVTSGERPRAAFPTSRFLGGILAGPLIWLWWKARLNACDDTNWVIGSNWVANLFEYLGGRIAINGLANLRDLAGPCVFIANHMSTLETFLLPGIIRPHLPVTFVVKRSLTTMPVFGPIMLSRDPVVVNRANPREDLATVLRDGTARLARGISVIVFPQHTRSSHFDASQFNTIGIKLAQKANVPVVPIALKTDAWGQGKRIKEAGKIALELPARFLFGKPLHITGKGKETHSQICQFIQENLERWEAADGSNS